jgi:hypothetical protein
MVVTSQFGNDGDDDTVLSPMMDQQGHPGTGTSAGTNKTKIIDAKKLTPKEKMATTTKVLAILPQHVVLVRLGRAQYGHHSLCRCRRLPNKHHRSHDRAIVPMH